MSPLWCEVRLHTLIDTFPPGRTTDRTRMDTESAGPGGLSGIFLPPSFCPRLAPSALPIDPHSHFRPSERLYTSPYPPSSSTSRRSRTPTPSLRRWSSNCRIARRQGLLARRLGPARRDPRVQVDRIGTRRIRHRHGPGHPRVAPQALYRLGCCPPAIGSALLTVARRSPGGRQNALPLRLHTDFGHSSSTRPSSLLVDGSTLSLPLQGHGQSRSADFNRLGAT